MMQSAGIDDNGDLIASESSSPLICSWDKHNLSSFQSLRSQMLNAILTTNGRDVVPGTNNATNAHVFTRSRSTSAVHTSSNYVRAQTTMMAQNSTAATTAPGVGETNRSTLRDLLPDNTDYFSRSAHLLLDTPLPLLIETRNNDEPELIHLREPYPNETTFLLSRIYLRKFVHWARVSVVNSQVQRWQQWQLRHDESGMNSQHTFRLDEHSLRTLAALSIISDQYQLWDHEWNRWFASLESSWNKYNEWRVSSRDEKKDDQYSNTQYDVFLPVESPGPVDSRLLACRSSPLLLRRNVSLMMGGISENNDYTTLSISEEMNDERLVQFLARDEGSTENTAEDDRPKLAVCPVSASFYEFVRSTLGVICEDNFSISFQDRGSSRDSYALLHHEQSSVAVGKSGKNIDIPHPSCAIPQSSSSGPQQQHTPRPIEFKRRILTISCVRKLQSNATPSPSNKTSSYSKLMKEAMTSGKEDEHDATTGEPKSCTVEVYPVEFKYVVVDPTRNVSAPSSKDSMSVHSASGIALVSRVTPLSDAFKDFIRAVECNRSSSCVRLWRKSPCAGTMIKRGATAKGDGYDLVDATLLDVKDEGGSSVENWLRLDEMRASHYQAALVEILVEIRSSPTASWIREPLELENRLQVGDFIDAQDGALKWYEAIVRELAPDSVKVHYFGWGSRWDGTVPRRKGGPKKISPPMPLWTKTSGWRENIKVGQEVEVRQVASTAYRSKWYRANVIAIRRESDTNPLEIIGGAELEMNGENSTAPLKLLQRKRQVLVVVPQEKLNCLTPPPEQLRNEDGSPLVHPPYTRWVDLYGEEICEANTHISIKKQEGPATLTFAMDSQRTEPVEVMKSFNNLHGSGFVRESLRGVPPAPGSVGLHNLGNSCYMNSILQCVNQISPITQYFLKGDYVKHVNKKNPLGSGGRVATAYASFLSEIWAGEYSILAPRTLKQTVGFFAPQFNNNYQHDSQEFCQYLMDGLHEDLNRVIEKPYVEHIEANGMKDEEAALESWKRHLLRHDSVFVDYTQGMHRSHLTCPSCGKESIKFDVYSSISLPLVPSKDRPSIPLKDCLDQFAAGEQLDEHNAWYCSRCKKHVCALKLITLWNTPDILVLHLKRFTFEKCPKDGRLLRRKIEDKVDFPIDKLDLSSYILGPNHNDAPPIYKVPS